MAALTLADLRKRYGRIETFVGMMKHKVPFTMVNGDQKVISRIGFTDRSGRITEFNPSKDIRHFAAVIEWLKTRVSSASTIILMTDKERFALKEITRTQEFGGGGKGDFSDLVEAIFAIAVFCRFTNKNTTIDEVDVYKIINGLDSLREKQIILANSPNKQKGVTDKASLTLQLPPSVLLTLSDRITQASLKFMVQSGVNYANSQTVTNWSKLLYENNKYNKIDVLANGKLKQSESRVDVYVTIDDQPIDISVGLKDSDLKLLGLVQGSSFDDQTEFWTSLIGIDPANSEKEYYTAIKNGGTYLEAIFQVYKGMAYEINNRLKTNKNKVLTSLSKGIINYSTSNKPFVAINPMLTKQEKTVFSYNNLFTLLSTTNIKVVSPTNKVNPMISLVDDDGKTLLTIRCTQVNNKIRHVIEKGVLLNELSPFV